MNSKITVINDLVKRLRQLAGPHSTEHEAAEKINELVAVITGMTHWLEANQPNVFSRGIWDAINDAKTALKE